MSEPFPIAIAIADLHLSLLQPACRADKDWMEVQAGYLQQVKEIAIDPFREFGTPAPQKLPILCAGDIFDRWNAPPELINFALEHLPDGMLCVPGQHDLPLHRTDLMHRSGYGVLKAVKKIVDISETIHVVGPVDDVGEMAVHGFGWNQSIPPLRSSKGNMLHVALMHRYVWTVQSGYPGAPQSSHLVSLVKALKGYDVAVIGDNHNPFLKVLKNDCTALGCGTFIRRKTDEIRLRPSVGIICSDGTVARKPLDVTGDRFHEAAKDRPETAFNMKEFIESLEGLGEHGLDFRVAVENHLKTEDVTPQVKEIILAALDNKA